MRVCFRMCVLVCYAVSVVCEYMQSVCVCWYIDSVSVLVCVRACASVRAGTCLQCVCVNTCRQCMFENMLSVYECVRSAYMLSVCVCGWMT